MADKPKFAGRRWIYVQPGDSIGYTFTATVCTSTTANDGFVPYNRLISSVAVKAFDADGTDVTSDIIVGTPSLVDLITTVVLKWPTTNGAGRYKLEFIYTLDNSQTIEIDFNRLRAKDF